MNDYEAEAAPRSPADPPWRVGDRAVFHGGANLVTLEARDDNGEMWCVRDCGRLTFARERDMVRPSKERLKGLAPTTSPAISEVIDRIEKVSPEPGDLVLIWANEDISYEEQQRLSDSARHNFPGSLFGFISTKRFSSIQHIPKDLAKQILQNIVGHDSPDCSAPLPQEQL